MRRLQHVLKILMLHSLRCSLIPLRYVDNSDLRIVHISFPHTDYHAVERGAEVKHDAGWPEMITKFDKVMQPEFSNVKQINIKNKTELRRISTSFVFRTKNPIKFVLSLAHLVFAAVMTTFGGHDKPTSLHM